LTYSISERNRSILLSVILCSKKQREKNAMAKPINETPISRGKQSISLPEFGRTEQIIGGIF
jgi:hypothetical protein